jgi:hypothetical protein
MRLRRTVVLTLGATALAYALYHRTDAYRRGNRLFYADGRPNWGGRMFGRFWVALGDRGLTPSYMVTLETVGRRSGQVRAVPIVLGEYNGERYVVSMLGERSPWVGNVREAGGHAVFRHGARTPVRLVEVPVPERPAILKAYLARAVGARPHIRIDPSAPVEAFVPAAADVPVFRVEEVR